MQDTERMSEERTIKRFYSLDEALGWKGYCIETEDYDELKVQITTASECCEAIDQELSDREENILIPGTRILDWQYWEEKDDLPEGTFVHDYESYMGKDAFFLILSLEVKRKDKEESEKVYLAVSNQHNGYYCHNAQILFKGEILADEWI